MVKEEVQDAQSENSEEELSVKAGEIEKIKIKQEAANAGVGGIVETTGVLQEKIAKGIKDIFSGIHKERKEEMCIRDRTTGCTLYYIRKTGKFLDIGKTSPLIWRKTI